MCAGIALVYLGVAEIMRMLAPLPAWGGPQRSPGAAGASRAGRWRVPWWRWR